MNPSQLQPKLASPNPSKLDTASKIPDSQPVSPLPTKQPIAPMDSFFADLAGLTLSDTSAQTQSGNHPHSNHQSQHANDILTPTFLNKTNTQINDSTNKRHSVQPTTNYSAPQTMPSDADSSVSSHKRATSLQDIDPYSALRSHHTENQQRYQQTISAINAIAPQSSSSTSFNHNSTKKPNTIDPYAALRQLSHGPERLNLSSPPITAVTNSTTIPRSPVNTTWNSPPTPTKQQYHTERSFELSQTPFDQDKSYSKKTDEWVQAGLQLACGHQENDNDNDSDVMTQFSSSTATSSTTSHKVTGKGNNNNAFSDLDPLATYKQNKIKTTFSNS
ncbi:hypothetical protein BCR42DRAFT_116917 [Absidia repens]|uniref:Uncharacterized protein n=1 Tax=Absidia repens TaxID=90262 RepID=A0A1X2I5U9_9FUNG|nr:hypothetical protein BCR42DRAFT_116917 [Absidia repens]